ncbi:MAG: hypothetical protein LT071_07610 [Nocardioides sp.]|nr:hypothetical protein [Nocardioides sp.]
MAVEEFLAQHRTDVLDEAFERLSRTSAAHYEHSGEEFTRERLAELLDVVVSALQDRRLEPVTRYADSVAEQRFKAGFGIAEVQTALNVMEETIWRRVVAEVPADGLADALGLVGTVLGYIKDVLARRYVSLASQRHVPSLDLTPLFSGVER